MAHGPQCPCCAGTDVAHPIGEPCYFEEVERRHDEERAEEEAAAARAQEEAEDVMVACDCGADVDTSIRGECDECGRSVVT